MSRDVAAFIVAASEARQDYTGPDISNPSYRGARFYFDVTAAASTLAFPVFKIQGKIVGTTKYHTFFTLSGTTVQVQTMKALLYPGVSTASTLYTDVRSDFLPKVWRIASTNTGTTGTVTWSASVDLIG